MDSTPDKHSKIINNEIDLFKPTNPSDSLV
jgi:hypothetical protein